MRDPRAPVGESDGVIQNAPTLSWVKEHLWPVFEDFERRSAEGPSVLGVPTGLRELDALTGGLRGGDLVVVSGATAMGKSALALQIAAHAAIRHRLTCLVATLGMAPERCTERVLCSEARVDGFRMPRGCLDETEFERLAVAAGRLNTARIYFIHSPRMSVTALCTGVRDARNAVGIDLLVVDPFDLLRPDDPGLEVVNRAGEADKSRDLKSLALELNIPVLATVGIDPEMSQRADPRPVLSDLRNSGALVSHADQIVFVHRPACYSGLSDSGGDSAESVAELILAKNKSGPTGSVDAHFIRDCARFDSIGA